METPVQFRQQTAHQDGDGGLIVATKQDVSGIIEANKREYNSYDERSRWSDEIFGNKIASIPMTAIDDLNKVGIMRGFAIIDEVRFASYLNDPMNRAWRTRPGQV
jgi:hypothetical protein